MRHFIHLHGFCSTPQGSKATFFREAFGRLGLELITPDLNLPSFFDLTITRQIESVSTLIAELEGEIYLMGSSMGALVALHIAERHERVHRLVLLAPALDLTRGISEQLGSSFMKRWQQRGWAEFLHFGTNRMESVSYRLFQDLLSYREVEVERSIPTLVVQGTRDEVCPVKEAVQFAQRHPDVQLILLDTDHMMHDQLDRIWSEIRRFLGI